MTATFSLLALAASTMSRAAQKPVGVSLSTNAVCCAMFSA
jgi:hypothetical protein